MEAKNEQRLAPARYKRQCLRKDQPHTIGEEGICEIFIESTWGYLTIDFLPTGTITNIDVNAIAAAKPSLCAWTLDKYGMGALHEDTIQRCANAKVAGFE